MKAKMNDSILRITVLTVILVISAPSILWAYEGHQERDAHDGIFIGLSAGGGGSSINYSDGSRSITEDPTPGGFGALRLGYAFNESFAISLENFGFGSDYEDEKWEIGASFASMTWHPGGSGFYVRAGVGGGGGNYTHPEDGTRHELKDQLAGMFGIGYDFRLCNKLALGVGMDSFAINADKTTGYEDDFIGSGSFSIQLNWFI